MATSNKSRRAVGLAAVAVVAVTVLSSESGASAARQRAGVLADAVTLGADFENGVAAMATGGTVIPVTVTGGTVGATARDFAALRVTAKVGGVNAAIAWVDEKHLKVVAPATTRATVVTMQLFKAGVGGPQSTAEVGYTPVVNSGAPAVISEAGGATVTISGAGFLGVDSTNPASVTFGDSNATSFTVVSATKITAVAPAGTNGAAPVRVTSDGGASPVVAGSRVTYRAPLGISGTPVAKAGGGPAVLTITGAELGDNAKAFAAERVTVQVGGRAVPAAYVDATHVRITVPAATTDTVPLKVMHDGIPGEPAELTMAPVVTGLSATTDMLAGGRTVTVKVAGANVAGATDFRFGATAATCVKQGARSTLSFLCTVPAAARSGPVEVGFTSGNAKESRFTTAATFTYTAN